VAIVFSGPFQYDDAHALALRAMILVLQSRLLDAIRQELGGTYSITATPAAAKFPRPEYRVHIDWTCDPARTEALVKRVFEEIALVKATPLSPDQVAVIREVLLREFQRNSQDNGYLLNRISRRYEDNDAANVAAVDHLPDQIAALTGDAIQQAAQTYLDTGHYVKVALMPETK
jgi:zinc protease